MTHALVEIPMPSPEELEAQHQARREHQAEVMALLKQRLKDGPGYEHDWASWEEFVGELWSLVVGVDECEAMQAIYYTTGMISDPLRDQCWKILVSDEADWRLEDLKAQIKATEDRPF